ncbi:ParB/RepB/Spo0J family partition protein [Bifidobacterium aquikefiri]|uniref:Chromosome partitioning protein ParB n=1 Tax=Bifidobacterium aquikefiri TaxID=1653207 RepID=A0A261GC39_9BIFI|nr:chromosome partitioning protein ParB [Bifidobacterium aquikefiri]
MATRSRLGKGLGALFPDLPQVHESHKRSSAPSSKPTGQDIPNSPNGSGNVSRETSTNLAVQPSNVSSEPADSSKRTKSEDKSKNSKLTSHSSTKKERSSSKSRRTSVPHLDALAHPSDLFFGEPLSPVRSDSSNTRPRSNQHGAVTDDGAVTNNDGVDLHDAGLQNVHRTTETGDADSSKSDSTRTSQNNSSSVSASDATNVSRETSRVEQGTYTEQDGRINAKSLPSEGVERAESIPEETSNDNSALKPVEGAYLTSLKVSEISPNAHQPRTIFDEDELVELSHSIQEVGVLQPIVVRKRDLEEINEAHQQPYELIMGERRWRASNLAGVEEIPAIVKTTPDDEMLRDALLENLHRVALNPLEEAAAYQQMIEEFGLTQEQLSQSISKSRPQIANMLRLLQLPGVVQKKVASGVLSAGHARALLALSSADEMVSLANRIIAEGLSVRSTEEIVALAIHRTDSQKNARHGRSNVWVDSEVRNNLENHFETKVSIKGSEKKGKIEIVFSSPEDMQRIIAMLLPATQDSTSKQDGWV